MPRHMPRTAHISIHTPHAGSDHVRGHTVPAPHNFNPHSPCGERLGSSNVPLILSDFNPHSPCGERHTTALTKDNIYEFQSTLPMRGATPTVCLVTEHRGISIHTPHAGSDKAMDDFRWDVKISIHTPHAGSDSKYS